MIQRTILFFLLASVFFATACNNINNNTASSNRTNTSATEPPYTQGVKPQPDAEVAVIEMEDPAHGRLVIELYSNVAPKAVARFKELAQEGFYNGVSFHRISPGLGIAQAGDPLSKDNDPMNDGTGNSDKPNVPAEFSDIPFERGIVGAARRGAGGGMTEQQSWNTANAQFFIMTKRQPAFDRRYTVFGKIIEGMNNVDVIVGEPTAQGSERPSENVKIKSVTIQTR